MAAIVVVAKCPLAGKSKTRLIPLLGEQGAAQLAKAMLQDVLSSLSSSLTFRDDPSSHVLVDKIVLYAPPTPQGETMMREILQDELQLPTVSASAIINNSSNNNNNTNDTKDAWILLPMEIKSSGEDDSSLDDTLTQSHLGEQLTRALHRIRKLKKDYYRTIVFLGMDSPEIPMDEVFTALRQPHMALLCPAHDGGYGLLSIPIPNNNNNNNNNNNPPPPVSLSSTSIDKVFAGVRWSHPLTAVSQLKALGNAGIYNIQLGSLMRDIDEPQDVHDFCQRLLLRSKKEESKMSSIDNVTTIDPSTLPKDDCLVWPSNTSSNRTIEVGACRYSRNTLMELGLLTTNDNLKPPLSAKK